MENLFGCAGSSVARVRLIGDEEQGGTLLKNTPTGLHGLQEASLTPRVTRACRRETRRLQGMFSRNGSSKALEGSGM